MPHRAVLTCFECSNNSYQVNLDYKRHIMVVYKHISAKMRLLLQWLALRNGPSKYIITGILLNRIATSRSNHVIQHARSTK